MPVRLDGALDRRLRRGAGGGAAPPAWPTATVVVGLLIFGVVFALNSALHRCLMLAFSSVERVIDVGFYYASNACGRLIETLLSGLSFQLDSLPLFFGTAAAIAAANWLCARRLRLATARAPC